MALHLSTSLFLHYIPGVIVVVTGVCVASAKYSKFAFYPN